MPKLEIISSIEILPRGSNPQQHISEKLWPGMAVIGTDDDDSLEAIREARKLAEEFEARFLNDSDPCRLVTIPDTHSIHFPLSNGECLFLFREEEKVKVINPDPRITKKTRVVFEGEIKRRPLGGYYIIKGNAAYQFHTRLYNGFEINGHQEESISLSRQFGINLSFNGR